MSDKIREAFEKFASAHIELQWLDTEEWNPDTGYGNALLQMGYEVWSAAIAQPSPVVMQEPAERPTDAMLDDMRKRGLSIDGDNAYKRDLIDCIVGALICGKQGVNPPPAGHWAQQFWEMARAEGEIQEGLAKALPAAEQPGAAGMPLLHWYAMSFRDAGPNGEPVTASTNIGWPDQLITLPRIQEAKKGALVGQNAVMLACCYLGHATRSQILGKEGEA